MVFARVYFTCIATPMLVTSAYAHSDLGGGVVVNPPLQAAERDNAKLNFLALQAKIHSVNPKRVEAARSVYYAAYKWPKTEIRVCFWNGSDEQQRNVMQIADVWHEAVPIMKFDFLDGSKVRICQRADLRDFHRMADIRVSLVSDSDALYNSGDLPSRNGDWSYPGRAVSQNAAYPTTMNLVGAMSLRQRSLMSDYYFNVRHEFGHALSLVHEHQRRVCKDSFNIKRIAQDTGWSEAMASSQVSAIDESSNSYSFVGGYDINSIMQYNFDPAWYMPDKPGQPNPCRRKTQVDDLSDLDRLVVAAMYQPTLNETPARQQLIAKYSGSALTASTQGGKAPLDTNVAVSSAAATPVKQTGSVEVALAEFAKHVSTVSTVTIQVYPHKADQEVVLKAVSNLGYPLTDRGGDPIRLVSMNVTAVLKGDPTNSVLYTSDVSQQDVRYLALSLQRAGIEIKSIQPYYPAVQNNFTERKRLMQIGSSAWNRKRQPLSTEDILTLPLPAYGKPLIAK